MSRYQLLEDCAPTQFALLESRSSKGTRAAALGVVQRHDTVNGNLRVYPREFFENLFRPGSCFMNRLNSRAVCGHIEHPSDGLPDLRKYAVVLTDVGFYETMARKYPEEVKKLNIESPETAVVGLFEALSTPDGKIVEALWVDRVQAGASSRAQGSVVKNESRRYPQYPDGVDVVQNDVDEESLVWDIVARPSTPGAFPVRMREAIAEAVEAYRQESKKDTVRPSINLGEGIGGITMPSLSDIRSRISRVKPGMENLDRQPRKALVGYLREIESLQESLDSVSRGLNESQSLASADMRGELQSLRDRVMAHIESAFSEAESGRLPGASPMKVAANTTSAFLALNSDPALDYPSSQSLLPGGKAGAGAIQEPDKGTSDPVVPGPGVKPGVDSKLDSDQSDEERRKQGHGTLVGDPGPGTGKGVSGQSMGTKAGTSAKESITTDQAHRTTKGELGQEVVKPDEEGDGIEVDDYGRSFPDPKFVAGKKGSPGGEKTQGIVASQKPGGAPVISERGGDMSEEALANLNLDLVNECRALRKETEHWRAKYERANSLVVETGNKFRQQRRIMALERLVENNPALDNPQARSVLETARDEKHMVQIAEAILGTRARMAAGRAKDSRELSIKVESDGLYRLHVDGKPHHRVFGGDELYEVLLKMGVQDKAIRSAFDQAHGINEAEDEDGDDGEEEDGSKYYEVPSEVADKAVEVVAMVPVDPVDADDVPDSEGFDDLEPDVGDADTDADDLDDLDGADDLDDLDFGDDEFDFDDEDVMEAYHKRGKKAPGKKDKKRGNPGKGVAPVPESKKAKSRFQAYAESRGLKGKKQSLKESRLKAKGKAPVAGARRLGESIPPVGGSPTSRPPQLESRSAQRVEPNLVERVIAVKSAEKRRIEEARKLR
jgi:hypothetical protein